MLPIEIDARELGALGQCKIAAQQCLLAARSEDDPKETKFFEQAVELLSRDRLPVLKISDFNTTGLEGPCESGKPFYALVKGSGKSVKGGAAAGGSFGIGKSAVYAASDLQTAFYSTVYVDDHGEERFLCQGKTKFRSFRTDEGAPHRSIGYWGQSEGSKPVESPSEVPTWLRRDEIGTTVFSVGLRQSDNWKRELIASVVANFYLSIHKGEIVFHVEGSKIDANSLRRYLEDGEIENAALNREDFKFARTVYECIRDEDSLTKDIEIDNVGLFRLRLLLREGMPKRISINRNGMAICDNLKHFSPGLIRFPMFKDFIAMVEPVCSEANQWLRAIENPSHDELSDQQLYVESDRRAAKAAGNQLAHQILSAIRDEAKTVSDSATEIEELGNFFGTNEPVANDSTGELDPTSYKIPRSPTRATVRRSRLPEFSSDVGDAGGGSPPGSGMGGGDTGGSAPGDGVGTGRGGSSRLVDMPLINLRTMFPDTSDLSRRRICFTPTKSGQATVSLKSAGLNQSERIFIEGGDLNIYCSEGSRVSVDVKFTTPYAGPVEIASVGMEGEGQ